MSVVFHDDIDQALTIARRKYGRHVAVSDMPAGGVNKVTYLEQKDPEHAGRRREVLMWLAGIGTLVLTAIGVLWYVVRWLLTLLG